MPHVEQKEHLSVDVSVGVPERYATPVRVHRWFMFRTVNRGAACVRTEVFRAVVDGVVFGPEVCAEVNLS